MTLTQLRTFLAVAETVSVRAAAERLVVSQPSVSAAVSSLERELGVALVARHGRGLRVTAAGVAFAAMVRQSLGLLDQAVRSAQSVEAPGRGSVHVVTVTTAAERLLPPLLALFRREHPDADVSVQVGNRATVWEALREHSADLVIAGRPPGAAPARVLARAPNRLVLVGPAGADGGNGALAGRPGPAGGLPGRPGPSPRTVAVETLARQTWLLREAGSGTRDATDDLLADLGIEPPTMILGSNGAVEQAVVAGLGVALISRHAVADSLANGTVAVWGCPGTPLDRPWHLVAHASRALNSTAVLLGRSMTEAPDRFVLTADGRRVLLG